MAGLTKEQRAKREQERVSLERARMQVLMDIAAGKITPEEAQKLLNPVNEVREITVTRILDKDGKPTNKIKIKGFYARFPITLYAEHVARMMDEGHWAKVVEMARAIIAEGGESLELDAPPDEGEAEAEAPADGAVAGAA
jgi:hypothetical protein